MPVPQGGFNCKKRQAVLGGRSRTDTDGKSREVTIDIPEAGSVTVRAEPQATLTRVSAVSKIPYEPPELTLTPVPEMK
jgi:hypothetical protein